MIDPASAGGVWLELVRPCQNKPTTTCQPNRRCPRLLDGTRGFSLDRTASRVPKMHSCNIVPCNSPTGENGWSECCQDCRLGQTPSDTQHPSRLFPPCKELSDLETSGAAPLASSSRERRGTYGYSAPALADKLRRSEDLDHHTGTHTRGYVPYPPISSPLTVLYTFAL